MVASFPGSPVSIFVRTRGEPVNEAMGMACQNIQTEKVKIYVQSPVLCLVWLCEFTRCMHEDTVSIHGCVH